MFVKNSLKSRLQDLADKSDTTIKRLAEFEEETRRDMKEIQDQLAALYSAVQSVLESTNPEPKDNGDNLSSLSGMNTMGNNTVTDVTDANVVISTFPTTVNNVAISTVTKKTIAATIVTTNTANNHVTNNDINNTINNTTNNDVNNANNSATNSPTTRVIYIPPSDAKTNNSDTLIQFLSTKSRHQIIRDKPLHIAAEYGNEQAVMILLKHKAFVDDLGYRRRTPLHCAAGNGHANIVKLLIQAKATLDPKDEDKNTPLATAANANYWNVVKLLLQNGASGKFSVGRGDSPLKRAVVAGEAEIVRELLQNGAASDEDDIKRSLLLVQKASVAQAFEDMVPGSVRGKLGEWIIQQAASKGHKHCIISLLYAGVNINAMSESGTVLHSACRVGSSECVELLLSQGVEFDARDRFGFTALHLACKNGSENCVRLLIQAGADKNIKNMEGQTPLDVSKTNAVRNLLK